MYFTLSIPSGKEQTPGATNGSAQAASSNGLPAAQEETPGAVVESIQNTGLD